jgi:methionyl-tRNA synthetase
VTAEVVRQVAVLTAPVMPHSAKKLRDLLAQPDEARVFAALGGKGRLGPGTVLPEPTGVFPRYLPPGSEPAPETPQPKPNKAPKAPKAPKGKA